MTYRQLRAYTVRWSDGFTWRVDGEVFERVTRQLGALREVIVGLGAVLDRWEALSAQETELAVDAFAPTEADRAVFTAALSRALSDARDAPGEGDEASVAFVDGLGALHELFVTDVTRAS